MNVPTIPIGSPETYSWLSAAVDALLLPAVIRSALVMAGLLLAAFLVIRYAPRVRREAVLAGAGAVLVLWLSGFIVAVFAQHGQGSQDAFREATAKALGNQNIYVLDPANLPKSGSSSEVRISRSVTGQGRTCTVLTKDDRVGVMCAGQPLSLSD